MMSELEKAVLRRRKAAGDIDDMPADKNNDDDDDDGDIGIKKRSTTKTKTPSNTM